MTDRTPINTTAQPPEAHLLGLLGGSDDYITGMEARGQRELVASEVLPSVMRGATDADFEALGFVLGEPVDGDPLFRHATLPEGWTKQGTDHDMWSKVVDDRGIERVKVFYKAAFYDRSAHMNLTSVGRSVASMVAEGTQWSHLLEQLTDEERSEVAESLAEAFETSFKHLAYWDGEGRGNPEIAADYRARVDRLTAALAEVQA